MKSLPKHIGRYARSVESGWLGKVVGIEEINGDGFLKIQGVNELVRTIIGGNLEDLLDADDFQWFTPEDVCFLKVV